MRHLFKYFTKDFPLWIVYFMTNWLPDNGAVVRFRGLLFSLFIGKCGRNFEVARDVTILVPEKLTVGSNVYLAKGVWINAFGEVKIGDEVKIGPYVVISSSTHCFKGNSVFQGGTKPAPVRIGNGSWIAAHAVISSGVIIGRGNLIGANAVVTKNTPDNVFIAGVPAKVVSARVDNPSGIKSRLDL